MKIYDTQSPSLLDARMPLPMRFSRVDNTVIWIFFSFLFASLSGTFILPTLYPRSKFDLFSWSHSWIARTFQWNFNKLYEEQTMFPYTLCIWNVLVSTVSKKLNSSFIQSVLKVSCVFQCFQVESTHIFRQVRLFHLHFTKWRNSQANYQNHNGIKC